MGKRIHVVVAFLLAAAIARADQIVLRNGDRITGEVVKLDGKVVELKGVGGGTHTIPRDEVAAISTEKEMAIGLPDGRLVNGRLQSPQPARVRVIPVTGEPFEIGIAELAAIDPVEKEKTEWERWSGKLTAGVTIKDGNSNSKTASTRGNISRRGEWTRVSFRAGWDYVQVEKDLSDRTAFGEGKLDLFFTKRFYGFTAHLFEGSYAQDLHLRYTGTLGVGYQFIERKEMNLSADVGAAYVREDYNTDRSVPGSPVDNDDEYVAGRGGLHFDWKILPTLIFAEHLTAYAGFEDAKDFRGVSETSLTATLTDRLGATAMVIFEYDNTPAKGRGRRDTTYIFGITYTL